MTNTIVGVEKTSLTLADFQKLAEKTSNKNASIMLDGQEIKVTPARQRIGGRAVAIGEVQENKAKAFSVYKDLLQKEYGGVVTSLLLSSAVKDNYDQATKLKMRNVIAVNNNIDSAKEQLSGLSLNMVHLDSAGDPSTTPSMVRWTRNIKAIKSADVKQQLINEAANDYYKYLEFDLNKNITSSDPKYNTQATRSEVVNSMSWKLFSQHLAKEFNMDIVAPYPTVEEASVRFQEAASMAAQLSLIADVFEDTPENKARWTGDGKNSSFSLMAASSILDAIGALWDKHQASVEADWKVGHQDSKQASAFKFTHSHKMERSTERQGFAGEASAELSAQAEFMNVTKKGSYTTENGKFTAKGEVNISSRAQLAPKAEASGNLTSVKASEDPAMSTDRSEMVSSVSGANLFNGEASVSLQADLSLFNVATEGKMTARDNSGREWIQVGGQASLNVGSQAKLEGKAGLYTPTNGDSPNFELSGTLSAYVGAEVKASVSVGLLRAEFLDCAFNGEFGISLLAGIGAEAHGKVAISKDTEDFTEGYTKTAFGIGLGMEYKTSFNPAALRVYGAEALSHAARRFNNDVLASKLEKNAVKETNASLFLEVNNKIEKYNTKFHQLAERIAGDTHIRKNEELGQFVYKDALNIFDKAEDVAGSVDKVKQATAVRDGVTPRVASQNAAMKLYHM